MTNTINQVMTEIVDISVKLGYKLPLLFKPSYYKIASFADL
ncbi:MAG: hypothetical protein QXQ65_06305 [Conexivisphaerales archaeon]